MHQTSELELFPGFDEIAQSFYKSPQEHEEWREKFIADVEPQLRHWARCRALSEHEARSRGPYV